jgi:hypothetical protein
LAGRQQAREIDPGDYMPVLRRYTCDAIRVPGISVDISFYVFEFVKLVNDLVSVPDDNMTSLVERVWVAEAENCGAIASDEFGWLRPGRKPYEKPRKSSS